MDSFIFYYFIGSLLFMILSFLWYIRSTRYFLDLSNNKVDKVWWLLSSSCFIACLFTSLVYPIWCLLWVYSRTRNFVKSLINKYYKR